MGIEESGEYLLEKLIESDQKSLQSNTEYEEKCQFALKYQEEFLRIAKEKNEQNKVEGAIEELKPYYVTDKRNLEKFISHCEEKIKDLKCEMICFRIKQVQTQLFLKEDIEMLRGKLFTLKPSH